MTGQTTCEYCKSGTYPHGSEFEGNDSNGYLNEEQRNAFLANQVDIPL
jgi:hypothetical protein